MLELLIVLALWQQPATFGLAWDPVPDADLVGYRVYMGAASGVYSGPTDVGKPPITEIDGAQAVTWYPPVPLAPGTYFIAVTAYNSIGQESGYSNEVTLTLPQIPAALENLRFPTTQ